MMQLGRTAVVIARSRRAPKTPVCRRAMATKQSRDREALDVLMDCFAYARNDRRELTSNHPALVANMVSPDDIRARPALPGDIGVLRAGDRTL